MEVLPYGASPKQRGLVFMDTPGYDPVSVTGMVAGGANLVCFTTGRGSVFGCKPAPSIKLATNTPMYLHMVDDMDINCGSIVDGEVSMEQMGELIFQRILDTASGKQTKSEALGVGDHEFVPWSIGPVL
jgi:altronate hydrolase